MSAPRRTSPLRIPAILATIQFVGLGLALATDGIDPLFAAMVGVPIPIILVALARKLPKLLK